jgi:hypothetical protein
VVTRGVLMRRVCLLLLLVSLLASCGGDGAAGPATVSDLPALTAYLIGVLEAESGLAAVTTPARAATATVQAADLAEQAVAAYADFAAAVTVLTPPPEAEGNQATLIRLAEDGTALSERLLEAIDSMDLPEITAIALDTLDLSIRSVDEVAERQALITAVLAAHPERPLSQYLTAVAGLWIPLTRDYHRLTSDAQRKLLAADFSGAVGPYQELIDRFNRFLPEWDAVVAPVEAAEFHTWYREWAGDGLDLIGFLLADLRDQDFTGLQGDLGQVATWANGWSEAILRRNAITIAALENG